MMRTTCPFALTVAEILLGADTISQSSPPTKISSDQPDSSSRRRTPSPKSTFLRKIRDPECQLYRHRLRSRCSEKRRTIAIAGGKGHIGDHHNFVNEAWGSFQRLYLNVTDGVTVESCAGPKRISISFRRSTTDTRVPWENAEHNREDTLSRYRWRSGSRDGWDLERGRKFPFRHEEHQTVSSAETRFPGTMASTRFEPASIPSGSSGTGRSRTGNGAGSSRETMPIS